MSKTFCKSCGKEIVWIKTIAGKAMMACQGCENACLASKFFREACGYAKPCGIPSELADAVIRIADLAGALGIDLDAAIVEKMAFNENRPYKHGKRF